MFLDCVIKCPFCGAESKETMPERGKDLKYRCKKCLKTLEAKPDQCCVYCAFSNMICPDIQEKRNCCSD